MHTTQTSRPLVGLTKAVGIDTGERAAAPGAQALAVALAAGGRVDQRDDVLDCEVPELRGRPRHVGMALFGDERVVQIRIHRAKDGGGGGAQDRATQAAARLVGGPAEYIMGMGGL